MENDKAKMEKPDPQLFYSAFMASPIGIALENMEGQPLFVSPALCSMLGFTEEELCAKHCVEFSPPEDANKDWALFQQLRAGLIDRYHLDKRFFRRDGSLIWGHLSVSLFNSHGSPLVVAMVEDITDKRRAQEELQQSEANGQRLAGHLIQAQENERQRVARELHDDISQQLAMAQIDLERLEQDLPDSTDQVRIELQQQSKHLSAIASDVHAILHRLHPSKLEYLGIVATARKFSKELSDRRQVEIDFHSENIPEELPKDISLCLFRVLQEALQNAIRHSGSRHFDVSLNGDPDAIRLIVRDSGVGFDTQDAMKGPGLGLTSMKERLKIVNGDLSIESQLGHGASIIARVPISLGLKVAGVSG